MKANRTYDVLQQYVWRNAPTDVWADTVESVVWHKTWYPIFCKTTAGIGVALFAILIVEIIMLHPDEESMRATMLHASFFLLGACLTTSVVILVITLIGSTNTGRLGKLADEYMSDVALHHQWFRSHRRPLNRLTPDELVDERKVIWDSCLTHMSQRVALLQKAKDNRAGEAKTVYNQVFSLGQRLLGFESHEHGDALRLAQAEVDLMSPESIRHEIQNIFGPWPNMPK